MELKINIEKKHLIVFGVFVLLVVGGYAIADNWDSSKPFHETLFTDFITSKSGGPVKIGDGGVNLTIASWPGQPGTLSFILPDSYSGSSTYGKISFYGPTRTGEDQYDLSEFSVQADKIKLSGGDVEITGNLDVSGSCNGCGGGGGGNGDVPIGTIFVTSDTYTGDLVAEALILGLTGFNYPLYISSRSGQYAPDREDGLLAGDAICQKHADDVGLDGTWIALLSNYYTNVKDRIPSDGSLGPIRGLFGDIVAYSPSDLYGGCTTNLGIGNPCVRNPIVITEEGEYVYDDDELTVHVWTGSSYRGNYYGPECWDWFSNAHEDYGRSGYASYYDVKWVEGDDDRCDSNIRLYCLKIGEGGS